MKIKIFKGIFSAFLMVLLLCYGVLPIFAQQEYGHVYCRNASNPEKIALTFDDGPHPRYTEEILSILAEYKITATFFIIGVNAELYPEELQKIVDSGCEIGNHTYSHAKMTTMKEEDLEKQILQCENTIYRLTGIRPCLFRPPEGVVSDGLKHIISTNHYNVVLWSIDTRDWAMNPAKTISQSVMHDLKGGDIILMHDYVSGGNTTCDALRLIIPQILSKGYEFVTVSELLKEDNA